MPSPLFQHEPASLAALSQAGSDAAHGNRRFVARNFLIDENVNPARAASYHRFATTVAPVDFSDWGMRHDAYLRDSIRRGRGEAYRVGATLDPSDTECPETFRDPAAFSVFGHADEQLVLLRCERVSDIANLIATGSGNQGAVEQELKSLAPRAMRHGGADAAVVADLDLLFAQWHRAMDRRPAFVTFLAHMDDLLGEEPTDDSDGWPDEMCDRLGLYHFEPGAVFFLFGYTVGELAALEGHPEKHPLTLPTVLDQGLSYAFCPAPREEPHGFTMHLGGHGTLTPELLHPGLRLSSRHLMRVGAVTRYVPTDLETARKHHFVSLRAAPSRVYYALATDPI